VAPPSRGCHDIVDLENGEMLFCDSSRGALIGRDGPVAQVDALVARGLGGAFRCRSRAA
jgi:hypothetical protein